MEEKVLLDWKEAHAEVYAKFKEDLEGQLLKPYHQTILDLGDGDAESLQSVIVNLYAMSSENGFDIDKLYARAVESGDASAYCLCCYLLFDNGEGRLADAIVDKVEKPDTQEIFEAIQDYKRFYRLKMALLPSGIMQMAKTMTSSQSRVTLLHGVSLLKHSSMVLTQLTRNSAGWLPPIC